MVGAVSGKSGLEALLAAIIAGDASAATRALAASPRLALTHWDEGGHYSTEIQHYRYGGDTALHIAAAAYRKDIALDQIRTIG